MKYQWLLFDADGTLFDYDLAESKALQAVFDELKMPLHPDAVRAYQRINSQVWRDLEKGLISPALLRTIRFERLFQELSITADADAISTAYLHHLSQQADLIEGAFALIQSVSKSHNLALITNGLKEVQRPRFEKSGLADYFSALVISDEVGAAKPSQAYFDIVFEQIKHPPKESALVIGDNLASDIQGGQNYGLATCWFNPDLKSQTLGDPPTFEIHALAELFRIID